MKLTFLGTGAGESYPGLWCNCPNCTYARQHRGRNIRGNSCAMIDDTLMIDLGPTAFDVATRNGINLSRMTHLLMTHSHPDHLYPMHLHWRGIEDGSLGLSFESMQVMGGPCFTELPMLHVYGNSYVEELIAPLLEETPNLRMDFARIREGETFVAGDYLVTPVRGNHGEPGFAYSYAISHEGKTLLYALDTGWYDPDSLELLRRFHFDAVVMEGTTGLREQHGGHMCLATNREFREFLIAKGCLNKDSPFILSHMSPHWCPPYDLYIPMVEPDGFTVAYDGMVVEI